VNTDEEPSIDSVLASLWASRWFIGVAVLVVTAAAVGAAMLLPKQYQAAVILLPESSSNSGQLGALSSIASQFSGLASLAGVSVPNDSKKAESIAVLQSDSLTESYIVKDNLLPVLYSKKWDQVKGTWRDTDPTKLPTLWKANQYFKRSIRSVSTDTKTGIVTLTITWSDPARAATWANGLVTMANTYLRDQAIAVSERNISYLNDEAAKTDAVGVKQAIYAILQSEINKAMLARGSNEYALKVLDPAEPPEAHSSPNVPLWGAVGFIGSAGFALLFVVKRAERQRKRRSTT
jgi:uncharacterized protein involved in exopolysaccharide biosynthesis